MESAFELKSIQLARLLELGGNAEPASDAAAEELLRGLLGRPVPPAAGVPSLAAGKPCGDVLADTAAGADVLGAVKEYAKGLVRSAGSEAEAAAATALYYAAIAAAFVHAGARITEHSDERAAEALADLESRAWVPDELRRLFQAARAALEEKGRRPKS